MELGKLIESKKGESGIIRMDFDIRGKEPIVRRFKAVRGGLNWPSVDGETPGYYCILGEPFAEHDPHAELTEVWLLRERQIDDISFSSFCESLTDDCLMYSCETVYADRTGPFEEMIRGFHEWKDIKGVKLPDIMQAPFADNFHFGVSLVRDKVKHGNFKPQRDSILNGQLSRMAKVDLKEWPEKRFFAINALRYVISGLVKYRPHLIRATGPVFSHLAGKQGGWLVT